MKKKEQARDKKRIETKAVNKTKRARQDSFDASIKDEDRNPTAKEDMDKVLQALVPPIKYIKKADRPKKDEA